MFGSAALIHLLKTALLAPLYVPGVSKTLSHLTGTHASIFMLHRFECPERGVSGHDPRILETALTKLKRAGYEFLSLRTMFGRAKEGTLVGRTVAFTIDDGYFDHARIAAPVFEQFGCPVTMFLVSGFMDGQLWFWWDQIQYILENTHRQQLSVEIGDQKLCYELQSRTSRIKAAREISRRFQNSKDSTIQLFLKKLGDLAGIDVPRTAPAEFSPMSWDEARAWEKRGVDFGIHTVTHRQLSSATDDLSAWEIETCWQRLRSELSNPLPVLCYPFGNPSDFGEREKKFVRQLHLMGAVTASSGSVPRNGTADELLSIPRYAARNSVLDVLQCATGLEAFKSWVRQRSGSSKERIPKSAYS